MRRTWCRATPTPTTYEPNGAIRDYSSLGPTLFSEGQYVGCDSVATNLVLDNTNDGNLTFVASAQNDRLTASGGSAEDERVVDARPRYVETSHATQGRVGA
jgi:hypothetical protein